MTNLDKTPVLKSFLQQIPKEWGVNDFVLCGSAGLAFRGVRDVHDLDVLVRPALFDSVHKIPGIQIQLLEYTEQGEAKPNPQRLVRLDTGFDIFDRPPRDTFDFERALECADSFSDGEREYKVLCLRHILAVKTLAMAVPIRTKDWKDMAILAELIEDEEKNEEKRPMWFQAWVARTRSKAT